MKFFFNLKNLLFLLVLFSGFVLFANPVQAAGRFWVGGTGSWDNSDTTHWAASTGGVGGQSVPGSGDTVTLDGSSGGGTVTMTADISVTSITMGAFIGTLDANGHNVTLQTFSSSGTAVRTLTMGSGTWTLIGNATTIWNTSTANNFTLNRGNNIVCNYSGATGTRTINAAGTEATSPDFSITAGTDTVTFTSSANTKVHNVDFTGFSGTLSNGIRNIYGNLTISSGMTVTTGSNTTTFGATSGTEVITTNGKAIGFPIIFNGLGGTFQLADNLTMNGGTTSGNLTLTNGTFDANGKTVTMSGSSNTVSPLITGLFTFYNLTRTGTASLSDNLILANDIIVSNSFTANGNSAINRLFIESNSIGVTRTITAASVSITNADFQDITGAGAANWDLSAITGNSGDGGGNSGITFTTTAAQTWSGTSGGNWSTNAWTSRVPLPQDNVVISSAFSANQTITGDMPRLGKSINFTGSTASNLTFTANTKTLYGSLTLVSGIFLSLNGVVLTFAGRGAFTLTSAGNSIGSINVQMPGGTLTLQDNLALTAGSTPFTMGAGTFDANNKNVSNSGKFNASNSNTRTILMGSGTWSFSGSSTVWDTSTATGLTLTPATSTISITDTGINSKTFAGGGLIYNNLSITGAGTGAIIFTGANTFNNFTIGAPKTITFPASTTTTISGTFSATGSSGNVITINSSSAGVQAVLSKASGTVSCDYLSLQDSNATGGATWNPGSNSTNVSGNSGWTFAHATRTISNTGGNWSSTSTWVEGIVPTSYDNVVATATSGNSTIDTNITVQSVDLTGYVGTLTHGAGVTLSVGSDTAGPSNNALVFPASMTYTLSDAATSAITFSSISTTAQSVNFGGKTAGNVTFSGVGGSWQLSANMSLGSTATLTITNGIFNANGFNVTVGLFSSSNTNIRTITMGSGTWTLTGNSTTIFTATGSTNLTLNSGSNIICNYSGSTGTRTISAGVTNATEANSFSFSITAGSDTITFGSTSHLGNLDFTGFSGTWTELNEQIYGNLTISTGMTLSSGSNARTFVATSGTKTITTNGKTLDFPVTFNGVGGTWQLADNLTVGSTATITLTNGTLDANGKNITTGLFSSSNSNARTLIMGSGTWTLVGTGTVWNAATSAGFTLTPNTSTIVVNNSTATLKTFAGGGLTYNAVTFSGDNITVSGSNTFSTLNVNNGGLANGLKLTSGTTQTITNFTTNGSVGNLAKLVSTTGSSTATLSKSSGTISVDYMSIQDSVATGGATWYAGSHSTNVSGNTGWTFTDPPSGNTAPLFTSASNTSGYLKSAASVTFTAVASDSDVSDTVQLFVCKANDFTGTACGAGGTYCSSSASATNPTCSYTVSGSDIDGSHTYYANLIDNNSAQASSNPISHTFLTDITSPTVDAGTDSSRSASFTQNATVTDATSGIATYAWTQVSGIGTITFGTPTTEDTTVSANINDTYVIRLTATDIAGNSSSDTASIIWTGSTSAASSTTTSTGGGGAFQLLQFLQASSIPNPTPTQPPTQTPIHYTFQRYLGQGDHGQDVLQLQILLTQLGFFPITTAPNGIFGPVTKASVKRFQKAHGISQTGNVGPLTKAALNGL